MTTQELRELDAWIAERVMGWTEDADNQWVWHGDRGILITHFAPTTQQDDAFYVLKKCAEKLTEPMCVQFRGDGWHVMTKFYVKQGSTSLEEEICLFAKSIFSQTTK